MSPSPFSEKSRDTWCIKQKYQDNTLLSLLYVEALPGGAPMSLVWILKRLVSVFINASRRCRKLNENSLSLSEF